MKKSCQRCQFADVADSGIVCRRSSPHITSSGWGEWPRVSEHDWCGEFQIHPDHEFEPEIHPMHQSSDVQGLVVICLKWLQRTNKPVITKKQMFDGVRRSNNLSTIEKLDAPIKLLVEYGYLRPQEEEKRGPGRPSERYEVRLSDVTKNIPADIW